MEPNTTSPVSGNGSDRTTSTSTGSSTGTSSSTSSGMSSGSSRSMYGGSSSQRSTASLRADLSSLKNDLDSLVNRASGMSDDDLSQAYTQLMAKFSSLRYAAKGIASQASQQINRGVETTTEYVKDKPMQSMAVAAGAGLLLGLLLKRS